jgi:hypothetical protein
MRRPVILLAALAAVLALTGPALAVPPSPNHRVVDVGGRHVFGIAHFGDPNRGFSLCSAQGETVDVGPNFDGMADGLRGRGACLETHAGVRLYRMYWIALQVFDDGTWQNVAIDDEDRVDSRNPAYLINYTPVPGFCSPIKLTYRVVHVTGIRYDDGTLGVRRITSDPFQARASVNTQVCG